MNIRIFVLGAWISLATLVTAQIAFDPAVSLTAGSQPEGVVIADLNGDGFRDVATTVDAPDRILLFLNDGFGGFGLPIAILTGAGTSPHALGAEDLDGDNDQDLVVTLKGNDAARVYLNQGTGTFVAGTTASTGNDPRSLVIADLDGDGDFDVATSNRNGANVTVLLNNGLGGLSTSATLAAGQEPRGIAAGDFDGDGDSDLAVSDHDGFAVLLFLNAGPASFSAGGTIPFGGQIRPEGLRAADLDTDGDLDLAAAANGGGFQVASVMLNVGFGTFAAPVHHAVGGTDPSHLVVGDLDGDLDLDLATANNGSNNVSVLANAGNGTFGAASVFAVGIAPQSIAIGDVDGDGGFDLVTANDGSGNLSYLHNQNGGVPPVPMPTLTLLSPATIGTTATLRLQSPGDAGKVYFCPFSDSDMPGVTLPDGRLVPLNADFIYSLSIALGNPYFINTIGLFNAAAQSDVLINVPNIPALIGFDVYAAFVVLDPLAPLGVGTISPSAQILFQ